MRKTLTTEETAKFLNITEENVQYLLKNGHLKSNKKGKNLLISSKSVFKYDQQEMIRQEKEMEKLVRMSEELKLY